MTDHIEIALPALPCRIGVLEGENETGQPVVVTLRLEVDLEAAGRSGELADTVDYARVHAAVRRRILAERWTLVETLARNLVEDALRCDERIEAVAVTVEKSEPPLGEGGGPVRIHMRRTREVLA